MSFKFVKRLACAAVIASVAGVAATFSGCTIETSHPTAKITMEFNGTTYEITYKLYRNMYPQTVRHFIELADSGFYNDTIIHNYTSNDWYGGGYSYVDEGDQTYADNYKYASYFEDNSKEADYYDLFYNQKALTATVFKSGTIADAENCTFDNALSTLIGEFTNNDHNIDNGALESQYGGLRMYYTTKTTTAKVPILTGKKAYLEHDYKYNCATSLFAIQVSSSSSLSSDGYCLFGVLKNDDAEETLGDLQDDIADYISDNYTTSSDFTTTVSDITIENYEEVSDTDRGVDASYTVTAQALIVRSIKITSY